MTIHLLGTGASVSDIDRTTTMLAFAERDRYFLVDCGADAARELMRAGLDPSRLSAIILTHEHPDHISGFALLIEKMWLLGRRTPIPVYGPESAIRVATSCFAAYATDKWEGLPEREMHVVSDEPGSLVFDDGTFSVTCSRVEHPVDTIGLRVESAEGMIAAYSADTAMCDAVKELASGASLLIHEATGTIPGVHASPEEAAETARAADVERLVLVHIPVGVQDSDLEVARGIFPDTAWGYDGQSIEVDITHDVPASPHSL